ncbi:MAG: hypothetical protein ACYC21_10165 [Eubacteriales bacterium]
MSETVYLRVLIPIVILAFLVFVFIKSNNKWLFDVHKKIFIENPGIASLDFFAVYHLSEPPGLFQFLSRKETGIITFKENMISFLGYKSQFTPVRLCFPLQGFETAWVGKTFGFGRTHWFVFKQGDERHYFSAETGKLFPKNEKESKEIFEKISRANVKS